MDKLEKFVGEHRQEFDTEEPRAQVWDQIKSQLNGPKVIPMDRYSWVWKAAAVFLFGLSSYLLIEKQITSNNQEVAQTEEVQKFALSEIEMHYTSIIEQKKVEVLKLGAGHPQMVQDFQNDVGSLDSHYAELLVEFTETNNQRVLDAMINNLKLRIDILNYQISIIESMKDHATHKHHENDESYNI